MKIRYGNESDAALLAEIGARTFYDTYVGSTNHENLELSIRESYSPKIQLEELSDSSSIFLIAEVEGSIAGYAKLTVNIKNEFLTGKKPLKISRIYLLQEYIGRGLGKILMAQALYEAKQRGCDTVWLGVWEKNQKAIGFYKKLGFKEIGSYPFNFGHEVHNDLMMELMLD